MRSPIQDWAGRQRPVVFFPQKFFRASKKLKSFWNDSSISYLVKGWKSVGKLLTKFPAKRGSGSTFSAGSGKICRHGPVRAKSLQAGPGGPNADSWEFIDWYYIGKKSKQEFSILRMKFHFQNFICKSSTGLSCYEIVRRSPLFCNFEI